MSDVRTAIATVALALLLVFAGCASPQEGTEAGGQPAENVTSTATDNEAGAEPVNPPNGTNGTASGGTVNPPDDTETGVDGADANASDSNATETTASANATAAMASTDSALLAV